MNNTHRPIVLLSVNAVIQAFLILSFKQNLMLVFCTSMVLALLIFIFYFKKRQYVFALLFAFIIILSAVSPALFRLTLEKRAEDFYESHTFAQDTIFSAKVYDCKNYQGYSSVDALLTSFNGIILEKPLKCRINCYSGGFFNDGDTLMFSGTLQKSSDIENDGFNTSAHLKSRGIFLNFESASVSSSHTSKSKSILASIKEYTQNTLYKYIRDKFDFTSSTIAFALISGDKQFIDDDIKDSFTKSGTLHLLCVSGMHLSVILGTVYAIFSFLTIHKKTKVFLVILIGFIYTLFTGFAVSTIRAAIIASVTYTASLIGRKTDAYKSLFFSMLVITLLSPYSVFDISAQLSFSATLGILVFSEFTPRMKSMGKFSGLLNSIFSSVFSNIGAVIFTLPVSAYAFGGFSTISAISTLIISLPCQILLMALLLLMLLSLGSSIYVIELLCFAIGKFCHKLCDFITSICNAFSSFRYSHIATEYVKIIYVFIIIVLLLCFFIALDFKKGRFFTLIILSASVLVFSYFSLVSAIVDDSVYKVSYFRQNENDRQLGIKLGTKGNLLINADNRLCTNKNQAEFDSVYSNNYLLIIPDQVINPEILAQNIKSFNKRFGIKEIFLPECAPSQKLAKDLESLGINCKVFPSFLDFGSFNITFHYDTYYSITIDDGNTKTCIVYAENYDSNYFTENCHICAFFTRKTQNQFDISKHSPPQNCTFYTRLGKDDEALDIINTYSQKSFYIKE